MPTLAVVFAVIAAALSLGGTVAVWVRIVTKTESNVEHLDKQLTAKLVGVDDRVASVRIRLDKVEGKVDFTDREVTGPINGKAMRLEGQIAHLAEKFDALSLDVRALTAVIHNSHKR